MGKNKQIDIIEEAFKKSYSGQGDPEIPDTWQSSLMVAIRHEEFADDAVINRTETIMFRLSWVAAGIAAILVLIFGLFFNSVNEKQTLEDDFQNLYVDTYTNDMLTMNSQ